MRTSYHSVKVVLEHGDNATLRLKHGSYVFNIVLVDLPNEFIEIYKCVGGQCKCIAFDVTDPHGLIKFEDTVDGLGTIVYRFLYSNGVFAELHVTPVVVDVDGIVRKALDMVYNIIFLSRMRI
jgi:hypothetical protein